MTACARAWALADETALPPFADDCACAWAEAEKIIKFISVETHFTLWWFTI